MADSVAAAAAAAVATSSLARRAKETHSLEGDFLCSQCHRNFLAGLLSDRFGLVLYDWLAGGLALRLFGCCCLAGSVDSLARSSLVDAEPILFLQ